MEILIIPTINNLLQTNTVLDQNTRPHQACTWWNRPETDPSSGKLESTNPSRTSVKSDQGFLVSSQSCVSTLTHYSSELLLLRHQEIWMIWQRTWSWQTTTIALLHITTDIVMGFNQRNPLDRTVCVTVDFYLLKVRDHSEILSAQCLDRCLDPANISKSITTRDTPKRRMKKTLFTRHRSAVKPMMIANDRKHSKQFTLAQSTRLSTVKSECDVRWSSCLNQQLFKGHDQDGTHNTCPTQIRTL